MAIKRSKPEEIVVKLRQVEVLMGQSPAPNQCRYRSGVGTSRQIPAAQIQRGRHRGAFCSGVR